MKRSMQTVLCLPLVLVLIGGGPLPLVAQKEVAKEETMSIAEKVKRFPFRGTIIAVDEKARTITLKGKEKGRVFHIDNNSKLMKHGKKAKLTDATVGEKVGGLAQYKADGNHLVISLRIGPKPGQEEAPAEGEDEAENETKGSS